LRGPAAPGEFAAQLKVLAVGLLEGCAQFLYFLAVPFPELADLAGECEHEGVSGLCRGGLDGSWAGLGAQALDLAAQVGVADSKIVSSGARQRTGLAIVGPVGGWGMVVRRLAGGQLSGR
jgi:hypothetical protein